MISRARPFLGWLNYAISCVQLIADFLIPVSIVFLSHNSVSLLLILRKMRGGSANGGLTKQDTRDPKRINQLVDVSANAFDVVC